MAPVHLNARLSLCAAGETPPHAVIAAGEQCNNMQQGPKGQQPCVYMVELQQHIS